MLNTMHHSFTIIDVRGGYTNDKRKMLMCVIPTSEYLFMRDVIKELDPSAFFLITDAYETIGEK